MAVRGSFKNKPELRESITRLEITSPAELEKNLVKGTREALKPLKADVQATAVKKLPKRGGYAPLLARAVKVSSRVTGGKKVVALVSVTASGKRENRDLPALNRGLLSHPLFGNRRHWYRQTVRPGVVDDPMDRARGRVEDNIRQALDAYGESLARG